MTLITPTRRRFLASGSSLLLAPAVPVFRPEDVPVAFFLIGDTHVLAREDDSAKIDDRSQAVVSRLIGTLNSLPETAIPESAGGGRVLSPRGVLHAGDCIDTGDKPKVAMQQTEWAGYMDLFGTTGRDGMLKHPLFDVHGNHDSPRGDGYATQQMRERNRRRQGLVNVSASGLQYSFDWGPVHVVCLGIVVGEVAEPSRTRRYSPHGSLEFLTEDLKQHVGDSGRPVLLLHHIDVLRYSTTEPIDDAAARQREWDPADVQGYHRALRPYTIAGVLYGHTHGRNVFRWDGTKTPASEGIPTFNVDNSSHFAGMQQAFFYLEVYGDRIVAREYGTKDAWQTGQWTGQVWTLPLRHPQPA
ncbi:MAG: metallophosphoesterase family protein [Planctomycetota bacterium]